MIKYLRTDPPGGWGGVPQTLAEFEQKVSLLAEFEEQVDLLAEFENTLFGKRRRRLIIPENSKWWILGTVHLLYFAKNL